MDSAILSLLGAFLLSLIGLFVFIWSLRKGLLVQDAAAASVVFAPGESGTVDDPVLNPRARQTMQEAAYGAASASQPTEVDAHIEADRSSAFPVFLFVAFACVWLLEIGRAHV